ncbi:MAG: 2OG-Fe(II) oxygenase [Myxococcales bacterium]
MELLPLDVDRLRAEFNAARPFRWIRLSPFLRDDFVREVARAYPTFDDSRAQGREFSGVNERRKVQITDSGRFPVPVKRLADVLSGPEFLGALEVITGIPRLVADPTFDGGGMHVTGAGGRLDVHVDFNYTVESKLHRRLNILVYLNPEWQEAWGGQIELWDPDVKQCQHAFLPLLNQCLIFETTNTSYHGVQPVVCPADVNRRSFAAYYYTQEPPQGWNGEVWSTKFRARPHEVVRSNILMPLERVERQLRDGVELLKRRVKDLVE